MKYKHLFSLLFTTFFISSCNSNAISNQNESVSNNENPPSEEMSASCNHVIVEDKEIKATCFEDGLTKGSHCSICNEVFEKQEVIPASHDYELINVLTDYNTGIVRCNKCKDVHTEKITSENVKMPVLSLNGDLSKISKETKVKLEANYDAKDINFSCFATLKYQGASSLNYDKKNFNIQFIDENDKKVKNKLKESWGKESKYTLKANFVDYSQARNVVSGKLFNKIVHDRDYDDELEKAPNGGAVDGFPIVMYINDKFQGLYTLNIPKDNWMFGMKDDDNLQAMIMANEWCNAVSLNEDINYEFTNGFELEYCSTEENDTTWVVDSFNEMRHFLVNNNGNNLINGLDRYIDVERAIDEMLFTLMISAADNVSKNILWVTYDGTKWIPSVYDMDGTYGLVWHGKEYYDTNIIAPAAVFSSNLLWQRLWDNYSSDIATRFEELRLDLVNKEVVEKEFNDFESLINPLIREAERERWPNVPSQNSNNINQIINYYEARLETLHNFFKNYL